MVVAEVFSVKRCVKEVRSFIAIILLIGLLQSAKATTLSSEKWEKGQTFSEYLTTRGVPSKLLQRIAKEDVKFLSEIESGRTFYELKDAQGNLEQSLIPIGEEMQIQVAKERQSGEYIFNIIPIAYEEKEYTASVEITCSPYTDIKMSLHSKAVADKVGQLLKGTINTKKLRKGDKISFIYTQKTRMGIPFRAPKIKIAMLKSRGKEQFIFADEDGYGHKEGGKDSLYESNGDYIEKIRIRTRSTRFGMPLRHVRITSRFTHRRWHPILKRYRPHHGMDFGARRGTPLLAVYDGKVSFSGRLGGYGNVVKIKHPRGYESLYAHQSRRKVRRGQQVKKGQIIGYVGSTGRSTGPHLHFGLKKNGRWVNPAKYLKKESLSKKIKYKTMRIKEAKQKKEQLMHLMAQNSKPFIWNGFCGTSMKVDDEQHN